MNALNELNARLDVVETHLKEMQADALQSATVTARSTAVADTRFAAGGGA